MFLICLHCSSSWLRTFCRVLPTSRYRVPDRTLPGETMRKNILRSESQQHHLKKAINVHLHHVIHDKLIYQLLKLSWHALASLNGFMQQPHGSVIRCPLLIILPKAHDHPLVRFVHAKRSRMQSFINCNLRHVRRPAFFHCSTQQVYGAFLTESSCIKWSRSPVWVPFCDLTISSLIWQRCGHICLFASSCSLYTSIYHNRENVY